MRRLLDFNWILFAAMLALIGCGTAAIWSAGNAREAIFHGMWLNHLTTAAFGLAVYFALAFTDYRDLVQWGSPVAYAASIVLLVAVLLVGDTVYGGRRWLWFFQPSEVAKLCTILFLTRLVTREGRLTGLLAGTAAAVPALLILLEPDLGTTLAFAPAVVVMLVAAGVWRRELLVLLTVVAVAASLLLGAVYEAEKPGQSAERREEILRWVPLRPHQVKRVKTYLFPESDPLGAGYNLRQSRISIGSGGLLGRGLGRGENNRLKYLPPSVSMNDFVFCVWAEETGYVGSLALLGLFAALCGAGAWVAWRAADAAGRALALGVSALVFAHVYINIAMCVGLAPITGLPLPFISSGRTFLVVVMAGLGLVQSIAMHKEETE